MPELFHKKLATDDLQNFIRYNKYTGTIFQWMPNQCLMLNHQ